MKDNENYEVEISTIWVDNFWYKTQKIIDILLNNLPNDYELQPKEKTKL